MKTNSKIMILAALAGFLASSCGNENNTPDPSQEQGITFSFEEQNYESDQDLTRAVPRTETINLGDCEAEVSVETDPDTTVNKTRAITNKHYTIRAYQGSVKKAEIKGTFNGTKFTADSNSPQDMHLTKGQTYDFVAFNDDVIPAASGEELNISFDKVGTAYIGRKTEQITQDKKQLIAFEMKHVGARFRTQFVCQKHIPQNIAATLELTENSTIPLSMTYNAVTQAQSYTNGAIPSRSSSSPPSAEAKYTASNGGQNFSYTSTSQAHYFFPGTKGVDFKLTFNAGVVFWSTASGSISKLSTTLTMQANKSYILKIKLKPKFRYLFSDRTTGYLSQTIYGGAPVGSAKTPIGLVIASGMAIGLKTIDNDQWLDGDSGDYKQYNRKMSFDFQTLMSWEDGYSETWDAANNTSNVKGNQYEPKGDQTNVGNFPAFYHAGHYTNYFISSPLPWWLQNTKWYLPAFGEWKYLFRTVAFGDMTTLSGATNYGGIPCYGYFIQKAITDVGGDNILNKNHWTSSQNHPAEAGQVYIGPTYMDWNRYKWIVYTNSVRAFIRY